MSYEKKLTNDKTVRLQQPLNVKVTEHHTTIQLSANIVTMV